LACSDPAWAARPPVPVAWEWVPPTPGVGALPSRRSAGIGCACCRENSSAATSFMRTLLVELFETLERSVDQRTGHPGVAGRVEQPVQVGAGYSGLLQRDGNQVGEVGTVPLGRRSHLGQ